MAREVHQLPQGLPPTTKIPGARLMGCTDTPCHFSLQGVSLIVLRQINKKTPLPYKRWGASMKTIKSLGNDLLYQAVTHQVPSALTGLTIEFGVCPGVPLSLQSPRDSIYMLSTNQIAIYNDVCE